MPERTYRFGRFELRSGQRLLLDDGRPVDLGARALDVLLALVERRDRVLTKDELLARVWPGLVVEENNLQVQVSGLRKILGADAISTIPGRGYRFTAEARAEGDDSASGAARAASALPQPANSFIGRETEVADCAQRLAQTRLLTLTALGGCGKTRLAIELARRVAQDYPGGAWFVDLAPVGAPERVAPAVMSVLGAREEPDRSPLDVIAARLDGKRSLIVLDNCEHVLEAAGRLVEGLLSRTASVNVLATSRERLAIAGEQVVLVRPLAVEAPDAQGNPSEAVRLFLDRARLAAPDVALDVEVLDDVGDICRRLEGLPLAIELAAARARVLSIGEIRERLADRLSLLSAPGRSNPRQQTLRDVIAWSYEHLDAAERQAFRRLGAFAGGWTLEAARSVAMPSSSDIAAIDVLSRLLDKSLIVVDRAAGAQSRYRMLDVVRAYAREQLAASAEADDTGERHLRYCVELAEGHGSSHVDRQDPAAFARLDAELDNLVAAHDWCDTHPAAGEPGLRLVAALRDFLLDRGHLRLGRAMLEAALSRRGAPQRGTARAAGLAAAACLAGGLDDQEACARHSEQAVEAAREAQDVELEVFALIVLSNAAQELGQIAEARRHQSAALARAREHGLHYYVAAALVNLGEMSRMEGKLDDAAELYEQALAVEHAPGRARSMVHFNLSIVANERGDYARACHLLRETSRKAQAERSSYLEWSVLQHAAALAAAAGDAGFAARLWGAFDAIAEATGLALQRADKPFLMPRIDRARQALGQTAFTAAFEAGRALAPHAALGEFDAWAQRYLAAAGNAPGGPARIKPPAARTAPSPDAKAPARRGGVRRR